MCSHLTTFLWVEITETDFWTQGQDANTGPSLTEESHTNTHPVCSNIAPIITNKSYTVTPEGKRSHNKAFKMPFNTSAFAKIDNITKTTQEKMCPAL